MNNSNDIKEANRRAMPKFILITIICMAVGGTAGFYGAKYGVYMLAGSMKNAGAFFGMYIAPWLMLAAAVIVPVLCVPIYKNAKELLSAWDGENEEIPDEIDKKLSIVIWITSAALICSFFLIAASYSEGLKTFENKNRLLSFAVGIVGFFAVMIETVLIQQKSVDAAKKMNPEKKASVYDTKFQKKWMDSCDEAEKIMIGKCAFKAYSATNTVCLGLAIALAVCALFFDIGFLPSLVVCLIWIVNQSVYCREALKYSKAGITIA